MKQTRNFLMLTLCMAVMGFSMTSCLFDDDDNNNNNNTVQPLTPAQKTAMIAEMAGDYDGYIYFTNDSSRTDSVKVRASVTAADSVFAIYDFPYRVLSQGITNTTMHELIDKAGESVFREVLRFYANSMGLDKLYTFWALPQSEDQLSHKFTIDGKEHDIRVTFSGQINTLNYYGITNIYYPCGEFYQKELLVYILVSEIRVDDMVWNLNRVFYYYGKK